ncbi:MAG: RagB/SusD family nutrient uptake outer membrane protein [Bacteroidales bacterium]|nr:RagB/SusD family nutrient uptake outer membrane protein [Bacteroidales bacterium]
MKKNIIILAAAAALLAISCTNLDVDVKSLYTEYPATNVALEAKMADVYYCFRGALGRRFGESSSLSSDEQTAISFDGDYYDGGTYAHSALHNYSADDASIGWYGEIAAGITKANQAILDLGGYDSPASSYARAMRAFYLFLLMDNYGDVPIIDGPVEDGQTIERKPRAQVAEWLEKELLEVIPNLTEEVSVATYGKPTKWMAEALLAKIYLNWAVYTASDVTAYEPTASNPKLNDLVALCDDIIASGKFSLAGGEQSGNGGVPKNPYRAKFYPNNGPQIKDFIYAMPYDAVTQQGFQYARPRIWRQGRNDGNGGAGYFGTDIGASCGGNFSVTPEAAARFDAAAAEGDLRAEQVVRGKIMMYDPVTYEVTNVPYLYKNEEIVLTNTITLLVNDENLNTGKNVNGWSQGYKSVKYFVIQDDYKNGRNQSNDLPIFRFADVLLMKAEAIVKGATATNGDSAASLVNQVRAYAKAPAKNNVDLAVIENERCLEFFDENWRRNDMIRYGHFENEYGFHKKDFPTARFEKTRRILPIPTGVLNENTNWKQNPGY